VPDPVRPDLSAITAALATLVDAKLRADYAPWYPGCSQDSPRVEIYASEERDGELHVHFLADSYVYNQAQSGSDWADHYFYAGEATCQGPEARSQRLALVEHVSLSEFQTNDYDDDPIRASVRERIVARHAGVTLGDDATAVLVGDRRDVTQATVDAVRLRGTRAEPAPIHEAIRCPTCGSTNAGISELVFELTRLTCHACGHTDLTERDGLEEVWTARLPPNTRELPAFLPPRERSGGD
jgi:hypothetical protein